MKKTALAVFAFLASAAFAWCQPSLKEALRLADVERYDDANRVFAQLVAAAPTPENYFYAGWGYAADEEPDSARLLWEKSAAGDPKNAFSKVSAGCLEILKKNLENVNIQ